MTADSKFSREVQLSPELYAALIRPLIYRWPSPVPALRRIPLAHTFLLGRRFLRPGRLPRLHTYFAESLVDTGDDLLEAAYGACSYPPMLPKDVELGILKLQGLAHFIFKVEVPGVGFVGEFPVPAYGVRDRRTGELLYTDAPILRGFEEPQALATMQGLAAEPLPRHRAEGPRTSSGASVIETEPLSWFRLPGEEHVRLVYTSAPGQWKDTRTGETFAFTEDGPQTEPLPFPFALSVGGRRGRMLRFA